MRLFSRTGGIFTSLCLGVLSFLACSVMFVGTTDASKFKFGKDGAIKATQDVNIGGMNDNGAGAVKRDDALLDVIKGGVNWVLGILALVALVFAIYGGIKIATARGDEGGYSDGMKIVQRAMVGLLIIGVAWFIISAIFWLVRVAGEGGLGGASTDS